MFVVTSHKLFLELLKDKERKTLLEQMRKRSATVNLSAKPLPSFYDIPGTGASLLLLLITFRAQFQVVSSVRSFSRREHRAAGAAAHPVPGATEDQADPHRATRHGGAALLESQQQGLITPEAET